MVYITYLCPIISHWEQINILSISIPSSSLVPLKLILYEEFKSIFKWKLDDATHICL